MRGIRTGIGAMVAAGLLAGSAMAVAAQEEPTDPMATAWVTGEIGWAPACDGPTITVVDGVTQERGHRCEPRIVRSDDPRLSGTSFITWNKDVHTTEDDRTFSLLSLTVDIRGEGGGWVCQAGVGHDEGSSFFFDPVQGSYLFTCTGDGNNAGLMALLAVDPERGSDQFEGPIFASDLPPAPELATAE